MNFDPANAVPEPTFDPTNAVPDDGPPVKEVLRQAAKVKPDTAAEVVRLAKRYPVPREVIQRNFDDWQLHAYAEDADNKVAGAPKLAGAMRKDPLLAELAHDDIEPLAKIESGFAKTAAASAAQAVLGISEGIWRTPDAAQRAVSYLASTVERTGLPQYLNPIRGVQDVLQLLSEGRLPVGPKLFTGTDDVANKISDAQKTLTDRQTFGDAFADVQTMAQNADKALATAVQTGDLQQLGQVITDPSYWAAFLSQAAPSLYAAMKSGGSVAFMGWLEGMEQASNAAEFEQKTGQKISDADFTQAFAQTALVNSLLEKFGLDKVLGAKGNGLMGLAKAMVGEGGTEALQQINSNLAALFAYNDEQSISEGVLASLMGGVGSGGALSATQQAAERVQRMADRQGQEKRAATEGAKALAEQMKLAGGALLRERSPEQFRALMGEMTDGSIHVDGEVLNQLPPEVLNQLPEAVRSQIADAAAANTTVEIPMADVLTVAPGTPLEQVLNDHARMDPFAPSLADTKDAAAKAGELLKQEAQRVIQQASGQEAMQASADAVKANILGQLQATGRFREAVNEGYATWASAFYTAYGSRMGMSPEQFYQRYPLRVLGAPSTGQGAGQSEVMDQPGSTKFDAWFGDSKVVDVEGKPLVVYHGSRARFTEFSKEKIGKQTDSGYLGAGFYFGDRRHAGMYAGMTPEAARNQAEDREWQGDAFVPVGARSALYPVFLSLKNPLVLQEMRDPDSPRRTLDREKHVRDTLGLPRTATAAEVTAAAEAAGYDGVVFEYERGDPNSPWPLDREYVAFRPEQIKSATGNNGNFDPQNPSILEQRAARPLFDQAREENFRRWSNDAPLVTSADATTRQFKTGEKVVVEAFHGTKRPDRVGTKFLKKRATSGPMAYHTSDPTLASSYATGKQDTSLSMEDQDYSNWFKVKLPGERSATDFVRSWYRLDAATKDKIAALAPRVTFSEEQEADGGNKIVLGDESVTSGTGSYAYNLAATRTTWDRRGNPLKALVEDWLNSGNLFNDEQRFMQVLKLAGFPMQSVEYDSPHSEFPFVYKNYIAMQKPLVTSDVPQEVKDALNAAAKKDRSRAQAGGADAWDKNTRTLKEWVAAFNSEDNTYVWTSIPDKVTEVFKSLGYDGIIDWSGKGGGPAALVAPVYIPFEETQVKSALGNKGTFSDTKNDILAQQAQTPRGTFNPRSLELVLNPNANLSTFFHETGHFFLEVMADIASQPNPPAQIAEDWQTFLKWIGASDADWRSWQAEYAATNRFNPRMEAAHERWAESIEQYVMEGKAPSVELQPLMRRFSAWLKSVYGSIKQFLAQRGVPVAGGDALNQSAYHGTPHRGIDKFTTDKIGTGEGFQAFGWGLYFTNKRDIAEWYREKLTAEDATQAPRRFVKGVEVQPGTGGYFAARLVESSTLAAARKDVASWVKDADSWGAKRKADKGEQETLRVWQEALVVLNEATSKKDFTSKAAQGQLYEVELPDDENLLLWDKPLGQQPEKVRKALKDSGLAKELKDNLSDYSSPMGTRGKLLGENIYAYLQWKLGSDKAASERLRGLGVLGTNYPAGTIAGNKNSRARNYVIFSGDDVRIRDQFYQGNQPTGPALQLNDDIRRVMDRMLATDEQIAQANEVAGLVPDENADALANERLRKRSIADLKWSVKARDKAIAALRKQAASIEKGIREAVTAEVNQMPEARAKAALDALAVDTEYAGAVATWKAARDAAEAAARKEITDALVAAEEAKGEPLKGLKKGQFLAKLKSEISNKTDAAMIVWERANKKPAKARYADDQDLATVADSFGYESVDAMLQAVDAFDRRDLIDGMTEQRMLEEHGDLIDERAIQEAANEAVHNEARARSLATELRTQAEMLGARSDTGETNAKGSKITVNALVEAAKQFAANVVSKTALRDLKARAWQHTAAERRAAKRWTEATAAGKTEEAVKAKQDQMLNHAAAKAAIDAKNEAQKILDFFRRVAKGNNETVVEKGRDPDIVNAARAVLAAYGVETPTTKAAAEYLDTLKTNDPDTFSAVEPMMVEAMQNAQPLDALTFDQLLGLHEQIEAMWHLAKRSRQMEVDGDLMDVEDVADEVYAKLEEIGIPDTIPGESGAVTDREQNVRRLQFARALLRRVEQWAEGLDGKFGGPLLRYIFQPVKDAGDRYRTDRLRYRKKFQALVDNVAPLMTHQLIAAPELGYTFGKGHNGIGHAELLHAILHTGNESNKRKLLLGREIKEGPLAGRKWADENADGTLDTSRWDAFLARLVSEGVLQPAHYDFAQGVWDLLEETKPLAQKTHRDVFGRYFAEVTADAFVDPFGVTRSGGYVPAQADPEIVADADIRALAEMENESMAYSFPSPGKGFTKSRVEYNRPLKLDLRTIPQHIDKVLLFSHMTPAVRGVTKLLRQKKVSQPLGRIDPAAYSGMLLPWLNRSARQQVETPIVGDGRIAKVLTAIRNRAGAALMFANVSNTIQQITGLSGAAVKVRPALLVKSAAAFISAPRQTAAAVAAASPYMADRMTNEVAAMNDEMEKILLNPSAYERAQSWTRRHAYFLQSAFDNTLSPIVWTGAYNQALEDGLDPRMAVRFADGVVRQTQGTTLPEDVSRIESGPPYARVFTQFVSYFNMMANTNGTALQQIAREVGLKKGAGKALYVVTLGMLVPLWTAEAIAQAFRGGPDDEDDDGYLDDWLAAVFGMGTIKGVLAQVPFIGQLANAGLNRLNNNPADDKVSLSPAVSLLEASVGAPVSVYKAIVEDGNQQKAIRDVASLVSIATGLPATAVARPLGYAAGVAQGKIEPTGPVDAARGLVTGVASPASK